MRIDDAGLTSEGGANGRAVSTVNMEITGRGENQRSGEENTSRPGRECECEKVGGEINKEGWRSCVFSVQGRE